MDVPPGRLTARPAPAPGPRSSRALRPASRCRRSLRPRGRVVRRARPRRARHRSRPAADHSRRTCWPTSPADTQLLRPPPTISSVSSSWPFASRRRAASTKSGLPAASVATAIEVGASASPDAHGSEVVVEGGLCRSGGDARQWHRSRRSAARSPTTARCRRSRSRRRRARSTAYRCRWPSCWRGSDR